ncbi:hypothetical protein CSHISOI_06004 [Colletotrichum shisoi]|uniref:Integral membrane protein n=1 Tax=Colletotrichum shisoi TaxID=2078593 RepID=A0A5Q4BR67_9PEZI|nr:hypothetical protein CSHISOI_06004 [Colletotrichum shisoi]
MPPDETIAPVWLGVTSSLLVALLVTTTLRLWARVGRRNLGWDDYTIAASALSATIRYVFGIMQMPHGNGRHRVYLTNHEYMMINIATSFGIVRAMSLGTSQDDLSWDFCITAIWSSLELFLGITAANIALSRAVYTYFFPPSSESRPSGHSGPSSNGYFHSGLRSDRFEIPATMVSSGRRRGSATRSSNSDIPLEPGVQKKTAFWWREDGSPHQTPESVQ